MWGRVVSEYVAKDASADGDSVIADLGVREVWEPQAMVLLGIYVVDTCVRSYLSHSPSAVLAWAKAEKKRK